MRRKRSKTSTSTSSKLPPNVVGNVGLFHVCYELSRRGFNVVPTSRNTKAVDVIVGSADFSRHATIQVKASSTELGTRIAPSQNSKKTIGDAVQKSKLADFWVFVRLDKECGYAVQGVHVCQGGDEILLSWDKSYWWYEPWFPTKNVQVRERWEKQKNEGGWQLITDSLSGQNK